MSSYRWLRFATIAVAGAFALPSPSFAQSGLYWDPAIDFAEIYDDNIFCSSIDEEDDFITRVTPALGVGYRSATFKANAHYQFDAEAFAKHGSEGHLFQRHDADAGFDWQATERLSLRAS